MANERWLVAEQVPLTRNSIMAFWANETHRKRWLADTAAIAAASGSARLLELQLCGYR